MNWFDLVLLVAGFALLFAGIQLLTIGCGESIIPVIAVGYGISLVGVWVIADVVAVNPHPL